MKRQDAGFEKLLRLMGRIRTARFSEITYAIGTRLRGLDFSPNSAEELHLANGCKGHSGTGGPELTALLKTLNLPKHWHAIDIGSGKGAACFTLAKYFAYVVGVEIAPELVQTAFSNQSKSGCTNLKFHCVDARRFVAFDPFSLVYMANPYSVEIAKDVMANLRNSLNRVPRPCVIILKHPGTEDEAKGYVDMSMFRLILRHKAPGSTPFNVFERIN